MKKIIAVICAMVCILSFVGCGNKEKAVENIIYHSGDMEAQALEEFYSDDTYTYYFPSIRSSKVIVYYTDGSDQTVKDALAEGNIQISDLDQYGIQYYKEAVK